MVQATSSALHSIGTGEGDVLSFLCPLDFVAFALHKDDEIFLAGNTFHCLTNVVHQAKLPALPFLCRTVFSGRHLLTAALILGQDTESVGLTDIITDLPQILQSVGILPELQTGFEIHGVDDEVGVDVFGIAVGGNKNFRTGPGTDSELFCHIVCLPGRDILCW